MSLDALKKWASRSASSLVDWATSTETQTEEAQEIHLPDEIILEILSYLPPGHPSTQRTLAKACLIDRSWYHVAVPQLYSSPYITGGNFLLFVRTICPSINAHVRRSDLAILVHKLDLSRLVHHSTRSLTARLLGRTKTSLTVFRAPAASFGLNCFAALSKCENLTMLDLALVNDSIRMHSLAHAVRNLPKLKRLAFPRSSPPNEDFDASNFVFPSSFRELHVSGGITDDFLRQLIPPLKATFSTPCFLLVISHCPYITFRAILDTISALGHVLISLRVSDMPAVCHGDLDGVLILPHLQELSVCYDYVTFFLLFLPTIPVASMLALRNAPAGTAYSAALAQLKSQEDREGLPPPHPLKILEITSSGYASLYSDLVVRPRVILAAMKHGSLRNIRHVSVSNVCGWNTACVAAETQELVDLLDEFADETRLVEVPGIGTREIGLFTFDD